MEVKETVFSNMNEHPDYVSGQSKEWCQQLASQTGKYEYTWNYHHDGLIAEEVLTTELAALMQGKVLDVGCGHGEYTNQWASCVEEIVGYDMTEDFIETANKRKNPMSTML